MGRDGGKLTLMSSIQRHDSFPTIDDEYGQFPIVEHLIFELKSIINSDKVNVRPAFSFFPFLRLITRP